MKPRNPVPEERCAALTDLMVCRSPSSRGDGVFLADALVAALPSQLRLRSVDLIVREIVVKLFKTMQVSRMSTRLFWNITMVF